MPYRIVFTMPGYDVPLYYSREREVKVDGKSTTQPEVTPDLGQAHSFSHPESARAYRDRFRKLYKDQKSITIRIQDCFGNVLFERDEEPELGEDTRTRLFVIPDDLEGVRLGFVVRPATLPGQGRVWCISPFDVESLSEHTGAVDTVYGRSGEDPVSVVERARRLWTNLGLPVLGVPSPNEEREIAAETKAILQEFEQSKRRGNLRPGDRR